MSTSVGQVMMLPAPASAYETTEELAATIQERCRQPINSLQIAALLESAGITDAIAQRRYGYQDVFTLAEWVRQDLRPATTPELAPATLPPDNARERISDFARGPLTMGPILFLSFIIMSYQEFGQWQNQQVLLLGLAMLSSLLVTSGFVQAASRKGSGYLSQGYVRAAGRIVGLILGLSLLMVLLLAGVGTAVLLLTGWLPLNDIALLVVAYITLSCLWLVAAVLFLLQQVYWYGLGLGVGVGLSYLTLRVGARYPLPLQQVLLLATVMGLSGLLLTTAWISWRAFRQRALASHVGQQRIILPTSRHLTVNLAPYFCYGVLYVLLIIVGHVPGWLGRVEDGVQMVAVSTTEVGLTLALGGYILVGGVAEHTMRRFWKRVKAYQERTPGEKPELFNQNLGRFFRREQRVYLQALVFCTGLVLGVTLLLVAWLARLGRDPLGWTPATLTTFVLGLVGYGVMAWGIFNCMFMITLSRPGKAITAVSIAILITLAIGLPTSRLLGYHYSGIGMVAGSLAFTLFSARQLRQLWTRADYYYYASF